MRSAPVPESAPNPCLKPYQIRERNRSKFSQNVAASLHEFAMTLRDTTRMAGILNAIGAVRRPIKRGETDAPMAAGVRWKLQGVLQELRDLEARVHLFGDEFLEYLITTAADEAQDQLRDDLLLRQEGEERKRTAADTGYPLRVV